MPGYMVSLLAVMPASCNISRKCLALSMALARSPRHIPEKNGCRWSKSNRQQLFIKNSHAHLAESQRYCGVTASIDGCEGYRRLSYDATSPPCKRWNRTVMEIGVLNTLRDQGKCFAHVQRFGVNVCQLVSWDLSHATEGVARTVVDESRSAGVRVCAVWGGLPGPAVWDFKQGPVMLGLVPEQYREERVAALKQWADFAQWIGAPAVITHCGFIPENLTDPTYEAVVDAIRDVAVYCNDRGVGFWFETGQETP